MRKFNLPCILHAYRVNHSHIFRNTLSCELSEKDVRWVYVEEDRLVSYFILGFLYLCAVQQFLAVVSQDLMLFLSFKIMANRYMKLSGKNGENGKRRKFKRRVYITVKKGRKKRNERKKSRLFCLMGESSEYLMWILIIFFSLRLNFSTEKKLINKRLRSYSFTKRNYFCFIKETLMCFTDFEMALVSVFFNETGSDPHFLLYFLAFSFNFYMLATVVEPSMKGMELTRNFRSSLDEKYTTQ